MSSDPSRAEALHLREVRVVRDHATSEAEGRCGDYAVCQGEVPIDASEEPGVLRQDGVQRHDLQARVFKGPHLCQGLVPAT